MKKIKWMDVADLEVEILSAISEFVEDDDKLNEMMRRISLAVRHLIIEWLTEEEPKGGDS